VAAFAQFTVPLDTNLFGDDIVRKIGGRNGVPVVDRTVNVKPEESTEARAGAQVLHFQDGRQLHGEIVSLTKDEIVWGHPDASAPLHFSRSEVRRIVLSANEADTAKAAGANLATVKLAGSDWLFARVASKDGKTFSLTLADGATLRAAREQIEWMYFDDKPVAAFGPPNNALAMERWLTGAALPEVPGEPGTFRLGPAIGRAMRTPPRFEVAFEIPDDAPGGHLWLQPTEVVRANSYTNGTIELHFQSAAVTRTFFVNNNTAGKTTPILGVIRAAMYRVLYDGPGQRLAVMHDGELIGSWPFAEELEQQKILRDQRIAIRALCFQRDPTINLVQRWLDDPRDKPRANKDLEIRKLRVKPWDGVLPKEGETWEGTDRLASAEAASQPGRIEAVSKEAVKFSGKARPLDRGTLLQLSDVPFATNESDSLLDFGPEGELAVGRLEIRNGQARCSTSFAPDLELPVASLTTIVFSRREPASDAPGDTLTFKNGDVLQGSLISAATGESLHWKLATGEEVDFRTARVAAVLFASRNRAKPEPATVAELRNGDWLRGELRELTAARVQIEHAHLGLITLEPARLWSLIPKTQLGARTFESDATFGGLVCVDGSFLASKSPNRRTPTNFIEVPGTDEFERYELRGEFTLAGAGEPEVVIQFGDPHVSAHSQMIYSLGWLRISDGNKDASGADLRGRLGQRTSRVSLRVFADVAGRKAQVFINGVHATTLAHRPGQRVWHGVSQARVTAIARGDVPVILSNVRVLPWDGELPSPSSDAAASTLLKNGDVTPHAPTELRGGKFHIESEIGSIEVPADGVMAIKFGGALAPEKVAGRIRLVDGSVMNVDTFRWDHGELTAHSAALGEMRVPAAAVAELVYDPTPVRAPDIAQEQAEKLDP
jgi:hypothetical protein